MALYLRKQAYIRSPLALLAGAELVFLAGADGGTVADDVCIHPLRRLLRDQGKSHFSALFLLVGADGGIVADDIRVSPPGRHLREQDEASPSVIEGASLSDRANIP